LTLEDDEIYVTLNESDSHQINVATNDNICCYPAVFSLITFDSTYIASATINAVGLLTVTTQATMPDSGLRSFLTYMVTCPNGAYDEASVYAVFNGSEPAVCSPVTAVVGTVDGTDVDVTFTEPVINAQSYTWELFEIEDLATPVQTGSTTFSPFTITGLSVSQEYRIVITSQCYGGGTSDVATDDFTVPAETGNTCGRYSVQWFGPNGLPSEFNIFTYTNCAGNSQNDIIFHGQTKTICALQTSPGNIVSLTGVATVTYVALC